jgi:hypothetical protein
MFGFDGGFGRIWLRGAHYLLLLGCISAIKKIPCAGAHSILCIRTPQKGALFAVRLGYLETAQLYQHPR